ncbi:Transposase [Microcystis aeruginosa]
MRARLAELNLVIESVNAISYCQFLQAATPEEQGLQLLLKANSRRLTAPIEQPAKNPCF